MKSLGGVMCIEKVLEMDDGKTVESRIRARHSGDQRMMDMLKVHHHNSCANLSSLNFFCNL